MKIFASKTFRRLIASVALLLVLLMSGLALRLLSGPVSLSAVTSYVERQLNETLEGLKVSVGDVVLRWSAKDRDVQVRLVDVVLQSSRGDTVAKVPEMEVAISATGLVQGIVAPTRISLIGPSATVIRKNDGSFNVGVGGDDADPSGIIENKPILEEVIELFLSDPASDDPSAYLQEVEIKNAKLIFFDQASRTYWRAPDAILGIQKEEGGIAGYMSADLDFGAAPWQLNVSGFLDPESRLLDIDGQFEDVVLAKLESIREGFDLFKGIELPLSGSYSLVMSSAGKLVRAEAQLSSQEGRIAPPFLNGDALNVSEANAEIEYDASTGRVLVDAMRVSAEEGQFDAIGTIDVARRKSGKLRAAYFDLEVSEIKLNLPNVFTEAGSIDHVALRGRWLASSQNLEIESASLRKGDSSLTVSGVVEKFGTDAPPIALEGTFAKFDVNLFPSLWPIQTANGAHDWVVANLKDGRLYNGTILVDLPLGALNAPKLPDDALQVDFFYSGITVRYINGLPPVKHAKGKATLFGDRFELDMTGGKTGEMAVSNGKVIITELHKKPSQGDISVSLTGETAELLRILDYEPLGYPTEFGVTPTLVGGNTNLRLKVRLPMVRDLAFKDVGFDGKANISELSIPNVINDVGIDDGDAEITVTNTYLDAIGVLSIGGLETNVSWREDFDAETLPTEIIVSAKLDGNDAKIFGADLSNALLSEAAVDLRLKGRGQDVKSAKLSADFTDAVLDIKEMGWRKPAGKPAKGTIHVQSVPSGGWNFKKIAFDADDSKLRGRVRIGASGAIEKAEFDEFVLGSDTDSKIDYENSTRAMRLSVVGDALNISGLIDRVLNNSRAATDNSNTVKSLNVDLSIEKLTLANGVVLQDVKGEMHDTGGKIANADFEGAFVDGGVVFASIEPLSAVERQLRLTASDAGKLLNGVDFTNQLLGGQLDVFAKLTELALETGGEAEGVTDYSLVTNGEMSLNNFRVVDAPILAQLLMAGSPQGAQDLLNRDGIGFDRFKVPFQIKDGTISFDRSRALGPAIGITVGGSIDQNADVLDLAGTIVPSYSINSALGNVPVVGGLFVSREGEGLFAFTYDIKGPVEDPKIAVNPLSALAPGFLRRIFQVGQNEPIVPKLKPGEP